jgi:hypothetical protein
MKGVAFTGIGKNIDKPIIETAETHIAFALNPKAELDMQMFLLGFADGFAIDHRQLELKSIIARDQEEILDA